MPGTGHIIYGLAIIIPILYFTKDTRNFSYKAAFIFLANNYIGPDAAQIFIGLPFHSMIGFIMFAIPLSLFYSYFSRFSLKKTKSGKWFEWEDEGIREVNWKNAYCLTVAGGISHFFIDQFYHFGESMFLWPDVTVSHTQLLELGDPNIYHVFTALSLIGYIITLVLIIFSYYTMRKGYKETFIMFLLASVLTMVLIFTAGIETFSGEREPGVIIHTFIYVLTPMFLLFYAARDIDVNPNKTPDVPKVSRTLILKIIGIFTILFALVFLVVALIGLFSPDIIISILASAMGQSRANDIALSIPLFATIILLIAILLLLGGIGLFLKNNYSRLLVISIFSILIILAFPFAIVLFLNEKEVKEMFDRKTG